MPGHSNVQDPRLCVLCRGKGLCGLAYCPLLVRLRVTRLLSGVSSTGLLYGSSPPSVFVGRAGYPRVRIGPASPPLVGDTALFDLPEGWTGLPLDKILEFRYAMVRGYVQLAVDEPRGRVFSDLLEIAMSLRPVEVEMVFERPPGRLVMLDEHVPPLGPASPLKGLRVASNPSIPKRVEMAYYDADLKAREAVLELYEWGLPVSYIQRVLSVGALGKAERRRMVPTRWAITAVDWMISESLLKKVKAFNPVDRFQVFVRRAHLNLFIVILVPSVWRFEWGEAWYPGSAWNPALLGEPVIEVDWEDHFGRRSYPSIGGCYYAARLATVEHLLRVRRQATAILWREIYPGFDVPVGVWFVREHLREAFKSKPVEVDSLDEALKVIDEHSRVGVRAWEGRSGLLRLIKGQRRLL